MRGLQGVELERYKLAPPLNINPLKSEKALIF